jgi:hypothetical protein
MFLWGSVLLASQSEAAGNRFDQHTNVETSLADGVEVSVFADGVIEDPDDLFFLEQSRYHPRLVVGLIPIPPGHTVWDVVSHENDEWRPELVLQAVPQLIFVQTGEVTIDRRHVVNTYGSGQSTLLYDVPPSEPQPTIMNETSDCAVILSLIFESSSGGMGVHAPEDVPTLPCGEPRILMDVTFEYPLGTLPANAAAWPETPVRFFMAEMSSDESGTYRDSHYGYVAYYVLSGEMTFSVCARPCEQFVADEVFSVPENEYFYVYPDAAYEVEIPAQAAALMVGVVSVE